MQKFFESTIISTYIKYLLSNTPLPIYPTIRTDDYMVAGMTYIYRNDILFCKESGRFNGVKPTNYIVDYLYVSDDVVVTDESRIVKHLIATIDSKDKSVKYNWGYSVDEGPANTNPISAVKSATHNVTSVEAREYICTLEQSNIYEITSLNIGSNKYTILYASNSIPKAGQSVWFNSTENTLVFDTQDHNILESANITYSYTTFNTEYVGGLTATDDMIERSYLPIADYDIVGRYEFGTSYPRITKDFVSNVNYYDSVTHRALGDYLRCLRDIKGLDLMGLYNCFDYTVSDNLTLKSSGPVKETSTKTKVILVPIKFNKDYTIAIECPFPVTVCPIFYDGKNLIQDQSGESLSKNLLYGMHKFNSLQFNIPQKISITNLPSDLLDMMDSNESTDTQIKQATELSVMLNNYERYLYLAIELPSTNTSSIVVLEGDYVSVADTYVSSAHNLDELGDPRVSQLFKSKLSLLDKNDSIQRPFSDKLISYLLRYTIDSREYIDENVQKVESSAEYHPNIPNFYSGMWDIGLRYALYKSYMELPDLEWVNKEDLLGFVDIDMENAINKGILKIRDAEQRGLKPYYG